MQIPSHGPSAVFTPPKGLQSFLGTQSVGFNPDKLAETVQGTLDVFPFLALGRNYVVDNQLPTVPVASGAGQFVNIWQVPQGKCWLPVMCSINAIPGVGGTIRGNVAISNGNFVVVWVGDSEFGATAAGTSNSPVGASWWGAPLLLPPGFRIGYQVSTIIASDATLNAGLCYVELDF